MKINFYIDYDEDLRYVLSRLTRLDPVGLERRLKDKKIPFQLAKGIPLASNEPEKKAVFDKFLKLYYQKT